MTDEVPSRQCGGERGKGADTLHMRNGEEDGVHNNSDSSLAEVSEVSGPLG